MTNGIVKVGDYTLRFGYQACMQFEQLLFKNASVNHAKIFTDLVYSGLYGEALRNEQPIPSYSEAYDILDEMAAMEDFEAVQVKIWDTYYASKWGQDFQKRLKEFTETNKKKELEEPESQLIQPENI